MAIILVLYLLIGLALRRSSSISNTNSSASHHHSPHHLCNQAAKSPHLIQRSNNSILLDNSSSPTATLIYNDSKSVTFCTNGKANSRSNALISAGSEQPDAKGDQLRPADPSGKLNNYLNKNDKDVNRLRNSLNSPSALKSMQPQFNAGQLRPSVDQQELIELNNNQVNSQLNSKPPTANQPSSQPNNQLNSKPSAPLLLSIHNGTTLAAHRPSDLVMNSHPNANVSATINSALNSSFNSSTLNTTGLNALNRANNHNLNSAISPTVNSAITPTAVAISAGNSIHHHRHHQAAASRRSVLKMLGRSIWLLFSPFALFKKVSESFESMQRWKMVRF